MVTKKRRQRLSTRMSVMALLVIRWRVHWKPLTQDRMYVFQGHATADETVLMLELLPQSAF